MRLLFNEKTRSALKWKWKSVSPGKYETSKWKGELKHRYIGEGCRRQNYPCLQISIATKRSQVLPPAINILRTFTITVI